MRINCFKERERENDLRTFFLKIHFDICLFVCFVKNLGVCVHRESMKFRKMKEREKERERERERDEKIY